MLFKSIAEAMLAAGAGEEFAPMAGRVMKGWVAVGASTSEAWLGLAEEARDFVAAGQPRS